MLNLLNANMWGEGRAIGLINQPLIITGFTLC